jgi:hypothetical protein
MFGEGNNPQDSTGQKIDALFLKAGLISQKSDSLLICPRNYFADITFSDSGKTLKINKGFTVDNFPLLYIKSVKQLQQKQYFILKQELKEGTKIQGNNIYSDWILFIILASAFLFSLIKSTSKSLIQNIFKSITYLGFRADISRDIGGLFHWQSTLVNLASFLNISLFIYFIQHYYNLIQVPFPQIFLWLAILLIVIFVITARHFVCIITGNISGEIEAFREYLYGIYQIYRLLGLILFVFIIFISFTSFASPVIYFTSAYIIISVLYFFRIIRLLIIFINRHIPIFYFILYLCALEIMPAVVLVKFFKGSI